MIFYFSETIAREHLSRLNVERFFPLAFIYDDASLFDRSVDMRFIVRPRSAMC